MIDSGADPEEVVSKLKVIKSIFLLSGRKVQL
jgi:hypothetical protein